MATQAASKGYKAPPAFNEGEDYESWRLDLELWKEFTSLEDKKQGTALLLELKNGKVKDAVRSLGKAVITAADGLTQIQAHLDKIFREDSALMGYRTYCMFEKFKRPQDMTLHCYVTEFERLLADLKKYKISLPETVLAYRFLNSASLAEEKVDLALATVKTMTYADMASTVGKIFSVKASTGNVYPQTPSVKVEPEECNFVNDRISNQRMNFRGRQRGRGTFHPYKKTPTSYSGCFVCGHKGHQARFCPDRAKGSKSGSSAHYFVEDGVEEIGQMEAEDSVQGTYLTFMVTGNNKKAQCVVGDKPSLGSLVFETLGCAILDSGCTKTVVGKSWVDCYRDTLEGEQLKLMTVEKCSTPFRFGDGSEVISYEKIRIPGCIGKQKIIIEANIVNRELPLLLSKASLKRAGAVLDFRCDKMLINGEAINLIETKSKHYCIPLSANRRLFIRREDEKPNLVLTVTDEAMFGKDPNVMYKKVEKLHRQFSHPPRNLWPIMEGNLQMQSTQLCASGLMFICKTLRLRAHGQMGLWSVTIRCL